MVAVLVAQFLSALADNALLFGALALVGAGVLLALAMSVLGWYRWRSQQLLRKLPAT
jgi:hypothetical protein